MRELGQTIENIKHTGTLLSSQFRRLDELCEQARDTLSVSVEVNLSPTLTAARRVSREERTPTRSFLDEVPMMEKDLDT